MGHTTRHMRESKTLAGAPVKPRLPAGANLDLQKTLNANGSSDCNNANADQSPIHYTPTKQRYSLGTHSF